MRIFHNLLAFCLLFSAQGLFAGSDNAQANGNWSASGTWSDAAAPSSNQDALVSSSYAITLDQNLRISSSASWTFNGTVIDGAGGSAYTLSASNNSSLAVAATVTFEGTANFQNNFALVISGVSGTTMTVGALSIQDNVTINIAAGCSLVVNGAMTMQDNAAITLNGTLIINGTATLKNNAAISGSTGYFKSTGAANLSNSASIFGSKSSCGSTPCISSPGHALPIILLGFTASTENGTVLLKWETGTEVNNDFFTLERGTNGISYESIGTVKGSGNSSVVRSYSFADEKPISGNSYYRLKQTDFDGKNASFGPLAIFYELNPNGDCVFKVFPNPCFGQCNVALEGCDNSKNPQIELQVMDAAGNLVYSKVPSADDKGLFNFQIDNENNLKPGIYIVRGTNKKQNFTQKMIVK